MRAVPWVGIVTIVLAASPGQPVAAQEQVPSVVPDTLAGSHVNQRITVEGRVANVKVGRHHGTTFLNFRFPYPDHSFSAWIPDSVAGQFPAVERLAGRTVRVTGTVWMQDDKWPAITLYRREDLMEVQDPPHH
jgi:hypothetical protein